MAKHAVTLYIDDNTIRLALVVGKKIKKWGCVTLEPGLIESNVVLEQEKVAQKIRELRKECKVQAKKVIVGISGMHSLTWPAIFPRLSASVLDEAVMREAKKLLPVPLEQLYITWDKVPSDDNRLHIFGIGIPRRIADSVLKTVQMAGLTPYKFDIKPLAIVQLITKPAAILVDVQPAEFDIVIVNNGIPQPVRTIPLQDETLNWEDRATIIRDDLERTMKFYDFNHQETPLEDSVPVYITGDTEEYPPLLPFLEEELGHPVHTLPIPLTVPEGFASQQYMVNAGLAAKVVPSLTKSALLTAGLDALPSAFQQQSFSLARVAAIISTVCIAAFIIPLIILTQINNGSINSLNDQINSTNSVLQKLQQEQLETKRTVNQYTVQNDELENIQNEIIEARKLFEDTMKTVTVPLPDEVSLKTLTHEGNIITIEVTARDESKVLPYAAKLQSSGRFVRVVVIQVSKEEEQDEYRFIVIATITDTTEEPEKEA